MSNGFGFVAFLTFALPIRTRPVKKLSDTPLAVASQDQWEQYEARNETKRASQKQIVENVPTRDRHHQIFLTDASKPMFRAASKRFMSSTSDRYFKRHTPHMTDKRLWILEAIADDTFGTLRRPPYPPRVVVMESLGIPIDGQNVDEDIDQMVTRWTSALNRAGKALSVLQSYFVEYAVWGGASTQGSFHQLQPGNLVACEVLNADWSNETATENMRKLLLSYAERAVGSGKLLAYQVLQSVEEPTMFKTVEIYPSMDDLRKHMELLDPEFAENAMQYRAAVNRVRQLHRCMDSLYDVS